MTSILYMERQRGKVVYCMDFAHIYTYEKHVNQKINYKIFKNLNNVYNMAFILLKQEPTNWQLLREHGSEWVYMQALSV